MKRLKKIHWFNITVVAAVVTCSLIIACGCHENVPIRSVDKPNQQTLEPNQPEASLRPIPRYGGTVLTTKAMPGDRSRAYLWAKNMGTLVAYETFLRRYPDGADADYFRQESRKRFVPTDEEWQEAWLLYSQLEIIDGAICDPTEGLIIIGRPGSGRLPPLFYDDLIAALRTVLAGEKVAVTMNRIFEARFAQDEDPTEYPYEAFETSVDFFSKKLWNTHLAYILFEGDRMLKSLSAGFDIFLGEPIRSSVPNFATQVEMEAGLPPPETMHEGRGEYGRVWIELTSVKINTTEAKNVAVFSDVQMEVRAESKHEPPIKFAKHIREHYDEYAGEFPIFGEVERAARIVAIARWLSQTYPSAAQKIVAESYEEVEVFVPQVIRARWDKTHKSRFKIYGLIGGVVFPDVNKYRVAPDAKVSDTELAKVQSTVLEARPDPDALAWYVSLGRKQQDRYVAWNVSVPTDKRPESTPSAGIWPLTREYACICNPRAVCFLK